MPDMDRFNQLQMLAKVIGSLRGPNGRALFPRAAWAQLANQMIDFGVRVHPDLATKTELAEQIAPEDPVKLIARGGAQANLTELVVLSGEIANAKTDEDKQKLIALIRDKYPHLLAEAEAGIAANPQIFEPKVG